MDLNSKRIALRVEYKLLAPFKQQRATLYHLNSGLDRTRIMLSEDVANSYMTLGSFFTPNGITQRCWLASPHEPLCNLSLWPFLFRQGVSSGLDLAAAFKNAVSSLFPLRFQHGSP
jgi:hypothetical protein